MLSCKQFSCCPEETPGVSRRIDSFVLLRYEDGILCDRPLSNVGNNVGNRVCSSGGSTLGLGGTGPPNLAQAPPPKFLDTVVLLLVELIGSIVISLKFRSAVVASQNLRGQQARIQREVTGVETPPPPEKSKTCSRMQQNAPEKEKMPKFFWGGGTALGRGIPAPQTPPPWGGGYPLPRPSAPPFECQTTFLHTGLGARPPRYFFLEPPLVCSSSKVSTDSL